MKFFVLGLLIIFCSNTEVSGQTVSERKKADSNFLLNKVEATFLANLQSGWCSYVSRPSKDLFMITRIKNGVIYKRFVEVTDLGCSNKFIVGRSYPIPLKNPDRLSGFGSNLDP